MDIKEIDIKNKEFQTALQLIQYTRNSVFLTGKAGTGKSTFLRYVCATTKKKHIVLAPTGIAAINAGGVTLHSFFKLPFYPLLPDDTRYSFRKIKETLKYNQTTRKIIQEVELIIIDEISMVRADIIDFIDKVLRIYTHNLREPFGGKQMLFVGDVFQLEPVVKNDEKELLNRFFPNVHFFSAHIFQQMELVSLELTKVYRQKDADFVSVLDRIRNNSVSDADLQLLNSRVRAPFEGENPDMYVTLATRRDNVDAINDHKLSELPDKPIVFHGTINGEFPENALPTLMDLELKVGAQVIFIKNDQDKQWVNGTIGTIETIDEENELLYIMTDGGKSFEVRKESWSNVRYTYNESEKRIEEEELGTFVQFPIRLAWAITIHKSQGLTFNRIKVDFSGGVFAGGQAYVALSRCTSLEGMQLETEIQRNDIFVRPDIVNFANRFNDDMAVDRAMKQAKADLEYANALNLFNEGRFSEMMDELFRAMNSRNDLEKPLTRRFIAHKLSIIHKLKKENELLKRRAYENTTLLGKLSDEYYQLGEMSIKDANDYKAGLANFEKALALNPRNAEALVRKGMILVDEKDTHQAMSCFKRAIALSPGHFKAHYNLGKIYQQMKESENAANEFDIASRLKPENLFVRKRYAQTLELLGLRKEADIQWKAYLSLLEKKKNK